MEISFIFILSAFFAGLVTFLAPCTLPLIPAYLGFISGVKPTDLEDPGKARAARRRIFQNGIFFILGFTVVFTVFGVLAGLLGRELAYFDIWLTRIGGVVVILFGLFMLGAVSIPYLKLEKRLNIASKLPKGTPGSSMLIGGAFAFGWTPCIGPVLGSILLLAGTSGTILKGGLLLLVFSIGLAIPFLLVSFFFSKATKYIGKGTKYLSVLSVVGGIFLIFLGVLLLLDDFGLLIRYGFELFDFIGYEGIRAYL